ncbi:hypothetical protein DAPPUDRAFT_105596 [Daphnia pulex]|uniref:Uncharacterized protein n=1 Tax=Daphnia pulex TaxID=6669 RepID=E9GR74_DAPPU|nr:hypothetical protein DAPPUDRAFT_105596 [Daphnia pulex]|eukprot:EFX78042.1 hypothetical protein DAPPUDRAFT_105596 [Daphnia pulex]
MQCVRTTALDQLPECVRKSLSPSDADYGEGGNRRCSGGGDDNNRGGGSRRKSIGDINTKISGAHYHPAGGDGSHEEAVNSTKGGGGGTPGNLQQQQQVPSAGIYEIMSDAASMAAATGSGTSHSP